MAAYLSPGIFVEEVDSGARPIEAVGTSTAGFVGTAPNPDAALGEAIPINNWSQFLRNFVREGDKSTDLANAVAGFFLNGGTRCYVANIPPGAALAGKGGGLDALMAIDEIAIVAAPGRTDVASYRALFDAAESAKDRFVIADGPPRVDDVEVLTRTAAVDTGDGDAPTKPPKGQAAPLGAPDSKSAALYFPWLRIADALEPNTIVSAPPSGHLAGVYARTDGERGVHKAPANTPIRGALGLTQLLTRADQDVLNPAGVNCLRYFSRDGILVWGARTLSRNDPQWRYVNVRRLFLMIEESIAASTRWVVFEPNDRTLWKAIQRDVGAFLTLLWRQGALAGTKPEEAFFVKCDEETNPAEVIDAGQVVVMIGIAPVKPAEFVIFRIGQTSTGATVDAL